MVDYAHSDLFLKDSVSKRIIIEVGGATLTNEDLYNQEMTLEESLCSEGEILFGSCEASVLKFRISDIFSPMIGMWMDVKLEMEGNPEDPFLIGKYKVASDRPAADRRYRDIVAYDAMHGIINASAISWYNTILPKMDSKVTMRQFRTSFVEYFGLKQKEITLANDDMIIEKTIQVGEGTEIDDETEQVSILKESSLSGKDVITAICEINGCFGHIGRDGKFSYIYLNQDIMGLYPSKYLFPDHAPYYLPQAETGHLYPQSPKSERIGRERYIDAECENFICRRINKLQIRQKENDVGGQWPEGKVENENAYIIEDNFLVYGKDAGELSVIAKNVFEKIKDIVYRPFSAECQGNPCLEVGDAIRIPTRFEIIESYILKRTLKGIQALRDEYAAEGEETRSEKANSISSSILQLKGKTNTLERNVEKTVSKIEDVERETNTRIEQTADAIEAEASARDELGKEVKAALSLKIDKDDDGTVVSLINGSADKIHFGANNMFTVDSPNLKVDENGNLTLTGNVVARNSFSMTWRDITTRPERDIPYVFVETKYDSYAGSDGIWREREPYLIVRAPAPRPPIGEQPQPGPEVMVIGSTLYSEDKFKMRTTPYFPNGAMIKDAYIDSLKTTFREKNNIMEMGQGDDAVNSFSYKLIKSGAFVTLQGMYYAYVHKNDEFRYVDLEFDIEGCIPKKSVCTVAYASKRLFVFRYLTDGRLRARNTGDDLNVEKPLELPFRFDFFSIE